MKGLLQVAADIDFVALDGDGVIFPNDAFEGLMVGGVSLKPKLRSHYDGQGISFLRGIGIKLCIITNAEGEDGRAACELVERWNRLPSCRAGEWAPVELLAGFDGRGKAAALSHWLSRQEPKAGLGMALRCAVMGNDVGDYWMLKAAGLPACPCDAEELIKAQCSFVALRPGGHGAVRDLCNLILKAKGIDPTTLPLK